MTVEEEDVEAEEGDAGVVESDVLLLQQESEELHMWPEPQVGSSSLTSVEDKQHAFSLDQYQLPLDVGQDLFDLNNTYQPST